MNNIIFFFKELGLNSGAIWLENETIKLSTPKKLQNEETKNFIINNKAQIISILYENNIFSKEKFLKVLIFKDNISNSYPLSPAQERLWFIEQYEQGSNAYHIPAVFELDADTDPAGIKYALQQIVSRHEVLRSTIEQEEGEEHGIQRVHDEPLSFEEITLTDKEDFGSLIKEDINRPFDLSVEYPLRVKFYTIESTEAATESPLDRTVLLINFHHIASDGWSTDIFERELYIYYESYINNDTNFSLPALEIQYKDYAVWQRSYLTGEILEKQLSYWKDKLSGYQTLKLPIDYARPDEIDYSGSSQVFIVDGETSQKLRALAQRYGVTLHSVMLSSINILLSKYTGQDDIITGSVIANRHHRQTEDLIGFFVNTLANRTLLNKTQSYEDLIQQVHQEQIQAQLYQDLPFEKLVEELGVERDRSRHPVFQIMFGTHDIGNQDKATDQQKSYLIPFQAEDAYEVEKFDLSISIYDGQEELMGQISYATALFHKDTIERIIRHYTYLLEQLSEAPEQPYSQHSLMNPEEYEQIVYDWNATDKDYPKEKTIYQLFQEQAEKTPDNIALVYEGQQLSYKQLNEKSNQLARHIREQYLQKAKKSLAPDTLIALYLDRSLEMVIGILAVLKAGGAYVPIDIYYPQERIDYLLDDTRAELILSQRQLNEGSYAQLSPEKVIYIDLIEEFYKEEDTSNLAQHSKATDLAYVIYTSGTTGKPKGVMVEQTGISSLIFNNYIRLSPIDVFVFLSSPVFDATTFEIWTPLLNGNTLIIPKDLKNLVSDINAFKEFIEFNNVSILWLTKTLFESLFHFDNDTFKDLNYLIIGGEALDRHVVDKLVTSHTKPKHFLNGYGPTESTTFTCIYDLGNQIISSNVPIGTPIKNRSTYVLYPNLNPVPIGIIGELYIGGAGLARGYLNKKDLTEERFIPNLFATEADKTEGNTRLYKTGDLVRWLPDGNLEYIGRNDDQVKIRGFRIELGEIEHALSQITGIRQSCVLAKERKTESGGNKYLVGYYILDNSNDTLSQTGIMDKLSRVLPEYMVPSTLVAMKSFPLTINGKLDKRALPEPDFSDIDNHIKPNTDLEIRLCQIYASVLGLASDQISTHQNFFRMGGNSILSIQLKGKLNRLDEFNHISVADLFKYNSINKLIQSIQKDVQTKYEHHQNITQSNDHEVAIISVSGAFSGVNNVAELWRLIANQLEGIRFYSKEECNQLGIDDTLLKDPDYIPVEGKVEDIELFDPFFWEISPNEAKLLDPQIRKFIEHCWFALESSGYAHHRRNQNIGVFAGSGSSNYFYDHILNGEMADQVNMWEASTSNNKDALATKTAYLLDLSGPANSINTACSTGLVSVVEACKNLHLGTCNMALAGGVSLSMPHQIGYIYEEGMILSKDGHCKTFDSEASGTTGGSGVAVVLLKRLKDAIKDNDNILGIVKGYSTNNDGARKTGYTAPSLIGQSECIINAQSMAGISADQTDYVECHGTATHLGDPIEVQALREAFQYNRPNQLGDPIEVQALREAFQYNRPNQSKHKIVLGAVKANIGHTDSSAGTAGLIKVVAMLQHNIIPGQVNFNEPNPELHLDQTDFEIIKENRAWPPSQDRQRLAGVSSFGVGGTNAHVIIGDYIAGIHFKDEIRERGSPFIDEQDNLLQFIIPLSAKSRQSLERYKQALVEYLTNAKKNNETLSISDIAYTFQERREHFNFRSAYRAGNIDELISKLREETSYAETKIENNNKVVFMFPGQGTQYYHMAKCLYNNETFFRNIIKQLITIANQNLDIDLFDVIYPQEDSLQYEYDINETQWTQISLFIIEYALAKYLEHSGVKADAYIGHSIGEYVAAALSGVFTLDDAIKLVIARGKLMQSMQAGSMLATNAKEETIETIVKEHDCEISVINSMEDTVVSGEDKAIKALKEALDNQGISTVMLNTSHAYHSKMMDQAATEFLSVFKDIQLIKPTKEFVSNVTGEIAGEEVTMASYWSKQLRKPVQFAKGINNLSKKYNYQISFIEVGTGKGLSYFVDKYKTAYNYKSIQTVQLLQSAKEANAIEDKPMWNNESKGDIIATLWMNGIITKPNDTKLFAQSKLQTGLPSYQFDYQRCWIEKSIENGSTNQLNLLSKEKWFSVPVWSAVSNFDKYINNDKTIFSNALVFIRRDQLNLFEFSNLADDFQIIVLDIHESSMENFETSKIISINPENEHHFEKLGKLIKAKNISFDAIIHMSSIENISNLNDALCYSFYSLFLIRQHLLNNTNIKNLLVLTNGLSQITNEDVINPSNGTLVGAVRNINHEFLNIDARVIDLGLEFRSIHSYISQIYKNISYQKNEELLAIRFGKLWEQNFENIYNSSPLKNTIQDGDIILITGGLGGVALSTARYISKQHNLKFILVSRNNIYEAESQSDYIKEKITLIEDIKAMGSSVSIICADISDINNVHDLVDKVKKVNGNITGIIHTAGVSPLAMDEYSLENIKCAFKGKVYGIDNILNTISIEHLRFLVSTSSLASIMGDVNRIEYCASNSFLDYLSADKLRFKNTKILSINWPGWSDIGMVKEYTNAEENIDSPEELAKQMYLNSLRQDEGSEIFYELINQTNYDQVVVSKLDINKLKNKLFKQSKTQSDNLQITILEDDYSDAEYQVAQIIGEALGIQQISIHDDFFKLGGNSILAIQVSHRMSRALNCDIFVADLFKHKTISNIKDFLLIKMNKENIIGQEIEI